MKTLASINSLQVSYGHTVAFKELSFNIEHGKNISIIGDSGCGKSSLLHAIAHLIPTTKGSIDMSIKQDQCAIMFQKEYLLPWKNVQDNILFNYPKNQFLEEATLLMKTFSIKQLATRYPHQLSGGEKQRVALARSLLRQPSLLLLDEPLAALDEQTRETIQQEIKEYAKRHSITLLLVTHSISEALFIGKKVLVMNRNGISHSLENPLYEIEDMRNCDEFFSLQKQVRSSLNKGKIE